MDTLRNRSPRPYPSAVRRVRSRRLALGRPATPSTRTPRGRYFPAVTATPALPAPRRFTPLPRAYAVLAGGGVKGAALVGCLAGAAEAGIEFVGYGGTSAGAIVALLAALGYSPDDMRRHVVDMQFVELLDDGGVRLQTLRREAAGLSLTWQSAWRLWRRRDELRELGAQLGLYAGEKFRAWVRERVLEKRPELRLERSITFAHLAAAGCRPVKLVASDLRTRAPVVLGTATSATLDVADAVRASMSYPFVFRPVQVGGAYLADGGLSSNLPMFLFESERRREYLPVVAFDLVQEPAAPPSPYGISDLCADMLETALSSGEHIQRGILRDLHHIRVPVPAGIHALDFALAPEVREDLYVRGRRSTADYLEEHFPQLRLAQSQAEALMAYYAPPVLLAPVLAAVAAHLEHTTQARGVRASVMLPTGHGTRRVVYQHGMDGDLDRLLEIEDSAGVSGAAWTERRAAWGDWQGGSAAERRRWHVDDTAADCVPAHVRAVLAVPITAYVPNTPVERLPLLGTLTVDSRTPLAETGWEAEILRVVEDVCRWAAVVTRILQ